MITKNSSPLKSALPIVLSVLFLSSCAKINKIIGAHETKWKQKELIITYSCSAPPTEKNVKNASAENFNMIPASEQGNLRELNRNDGSWNNVAGNDSGVFDISIEPGDGRLFEFRKN